MAIKRFICSFQKFHYLIPVIMILSIVFITGCQKKEEKPVQQPVVTTPVPTASDSAKMITDIKGKYTGTFDIRSAVLNINEQDGNKFKGSMTINYREVINQKVSGEFDPKSKEFSMTDLLHSRFQGKYKGKFSDDFSKMSGTFTMSLDNSKMNFKLTKK
jgi:hypothetical protein